MWCVTLGLLAPACGSSSNPNNPGQATLTVSGTAQLEAVGQTSQLSLLATQGTSTQTVTSQATWTSSNPAVATVSPTGLVTAQGFGTANVTASYQGQSQTLSFVVTITGAWFIQNPGTQIQSLTWELIESGGNVTGLLVFAPGLPTGDTFATNSITGTISGSTVTWTLTLTPGADATAPQCAGVPLTVTGTAQITGTTMIVTFLTSTPICDKTSPTKVFDTSNGSFQFTLTRD